MRRHGPVNIIMHFPKTKEGNEALARRVAEVHADGVNQRIKSLTCTTGEKMQLLDAVIEMARKQAAEQA